MPALPLLDLWSAETRETRVSYEDCEMGCSDSFLVTVAAAQSIEPPLADTRISVNTLVREDIFAGFLADDMETVLPQIDRRGDGIRRPATIRRSFPYSGTISRSHPEPVPGSGASAQHSAAPAAGKKRR